MLDQGMTSFSDPATHPPTHLVRVRRRAVRQLKGGPHVAVILFTGTATTPCPSRLPSPAPLMPPTCPFPGSAATQGPRVCQLV